MALPIYMEEGNAFGDAVRKAKEDGIQKGETVKVGGKTYPVKEDPANTPMPGNKLSPIDQYNAIKKDVNTVEKDYTYDPTTGERRYMVRHPDYAAKNLEKDSAQGRFAAPGFGDQGQFFGGSGNLNECGDMSPMANDMDKQEGRMSVNMNTSTEIGRAHV